MQFLTLSLFDTWFWTNYLTTQGLKFLSVKWKEIPTELSSMGTTSEEMTTIPEAQQRWIGDRWKDRRGYKFVIKLPLSFNIYCAKALKISLSWGISHASNVKMLVARLCLFVIPLDCSPPGSSVHGILQVRTLEWVAISSSRGSSWPRDWTQVSCIAGRFSTVWATRKKSLGML